MDTQLGVHFLLLSMVLDSQFGCPRPMARGQSDL